MKKFIYILTSIILACTSCTGELTPDNGHKKDGFVLTIYNAPLTKAIDNTGEAYERELRTLDIFFYPKGETANPCVFYHHEDLTNTFAQAEVDIYVVEDAIRKIFPTQNLCDIFVIANLPESVKPEDAVFEAGHESTRLNRLEAYVLQNDDKDNPDFEAEYDAINKPFVMAGLGVGQRDSKKNAAGTISLVRASSKITLSVAIPEYIDVKKTINNIEQTIRMVPTTEDNPSVNTMNAALHNGSYKGYLSKGVNDEIKGFYLVSDKQEFTYSKTIAAEGTTPAKRVYTCEIPFYTYAREWAKGAADAPYMTFEMKWGADKGDGTVPIYETYYYQILINGAGRTFLPNHWYDMFVNVGVIGSTIEIKPIVIDHLSFFVLDWSDTISGVDHPDEDVVLENYTYFNVLTKRLELDNVTSGVIQYKASHKIGWAVDNTSTKNVEGVENLTTKSGAFAIDCGSKTLQVETISGFTLTDNGSGLLRYDYTIPEDIYSPVYIYLNLWLEMDGNNGMSDEEKAYSESVVIVQYPPIYIIPDKSTEYSIFVNGRHRYTTNNITYRNGNTTYNLSQTSGTSDRGDQMYIISVSTLTSKDTFRWRARAADQYVDKSYIIGDPRTREPMNFANYNMTNNWVKDKIPYNANWDTYNRNVENGTGRRLQYYYPTSTDEEAYRIIAPRFRMSSFYGGNSQNCTPDGAVLRCASYQEDGYPAGRWRVPTTAEVQFVIMLQNEGVIVPVFYDGNYYYSASQQISSNGEVRANSDDNNTSSSVRCIYDEWYWGAEKEATPNNNFNGGYEFTWGDEQITW